MTQAKWLTFFQKARISISAELAVKPLNLPATGFHLGIFASGFLQKHLWTSG